MSSNESSSGARGFFAGAFSGVAKVSTGHPFDTIKVRLQTTDSSRFNGPWSCLRGTISKEGIRGLYTGFTPPLVGFIVMDSLLLGSFSIYRDMLQRNLRLQTSRDTAAAGLRCNTPANPSSVLVNFLAGGLAGWTVSFVAAPIEHVKARLQVQYGQKSYTGPLDCLQKMFQSHGITGVYQGLTATIIFRSFFAVFWASYDVLNRQMQVSTDLSLPLINFTAAGVAAQLYWLTGYPTDVVKQRVMTAPLGGVNIDGARRRVRWMDVARDIYAESGCRGFWRGFLPCLLRAFPANAMSIMTFEAVIRATAPARASIS